MKSSRKIIVLLLIIAGISFHSKAQNLTFSPYSRYGIGELNEQHFAHILGMGGTFIGVKPDTLAPVFMNPVNPAAIAGIRLTVLDVGATAQFSEFDNGSQKVKTQTVNFGYGAIGFPIKQRAAAAFGIMPYSNVGYNLQSKTTMESAGDITYSYTGNGGINKVFFGMGFNPFKASLSKFYKLGIDDSLISRGKYGKYKRSKFFRGVLSDLYIGGRADYLFGTLNQVADVIYPGSINYYNTRRLRSVTVGDVTGSFGLQTAFTIDSIKSRSNPAARRLKRKVKFGIGYYVSLPSLIDAKYSNVIYNYNVGSFGFEQPKDTVLNTTNVKSTIKLPLEQGIGLCFKKGELLTIATDLTYTNWQQFRYLGNASELTNSYRVSFGVNYAPDKKGSGTSTYFKRMQYRAGGFYKTGFLELKNTQITNYAVTLGIGLPAGMRIRTAKGHVLSNMVNISGEFGEMGSINNNLIRERYVRLIIGFTFNDEWFNKYRYD